MRVAVVSGEDINKSFTCKQATSPVGVPFAYTPEKTFAISRSFIFNLVFLVLSIIMQRYTLFFKPTNISILFLVKHVLLLIRTSNQACRTLFIHKYIALYPLSIRLKHSHKHFISLKKRNESADRMCRELEVNGSLFPYSIPTNLS